MAARQCLESASWEIAAATKQHEKTLIGSVISGSDLTEERDARQYLELAGWNATHAISLRAKRVEVWRRFTAQFPRTSAEEAMQHLDLLNPIYMPCETRENVRFH